MSNNEVADGAQDALTNCEGTTAIAISVRCELTRKINTNIQWAEKAVADAKEFYIAAARHIQEVKGLWPDDWLAIVKEDCNLGRSRAYKLLAIADKKTTVEKERAKNAEANRRLRSSRSPSRDGQDRKVPVKAPKTDANGVGKMKTALGDYAKKMDAAEGKAGIRTINPLIADWDAVTEEQRAEFQKHIVGLKKQRQLAKALKVVADPNRNLSPVQIGKYLELIGPDCFLEALRHAPQLWATVEKRLADQKLATSTFTQTRLLPKGRGGMSPEAIRLAADRAELRSSQINGETRL